MATKIRLKRIGRRNRPFYRMVAMDSRKKRDGAAIEELGWYNPIDLNHSFDLNVERILYWLKEGAQPTKGTSKLLRRSGIAHHFHLIKQGLDEEEIKKEMKKWELNRDEVLKARSKKLDKKNKEESKKDVDREEKNENKISEDSVDLESNETIIDDETGETEILDNTEEE